MKNTYILLFWLLIIGCSQQNKTTKATIETPENSSVINISKKQFESENMEFTTISEQPFFTTVKTTGIIDVPPENKASVSTFIGGYVTKIQLLIGDKVKKGQLIASLQNTEFIELQQEYLEVAAKLSYLKTEYERQKTLYKELITSKKNYLKAESDYNSNLAHYNGLHKKLQMLNIDPKAVKEGNISSIINLYAPISGYVTKVNVSNGSYISSENEVMEIVNTDHIHLELNVFEKDILNIKKHQKIRFKIPEASNESFDAEVYLVGTFVDANRTIKVHGHINDSEKTNFISGMFIDATIIIEEQEKKSLPKSAVLQNESNNYILVLKEENNEEYLFEKININIGIENEDFIEVNNTNIIKDKKILSKGISMF